MSGTRALHPQPFGLAQPPRKSRSPSTWAQGHLSCPLALAVKPPNSASPVGVPCNRTGTPGGLFLGRGRQGQAPLKVGSTKGQ